ncbi:dr1-associated corepressor [Cylas formicarius]|uniref:dr1-associated corepressor n=1 Tax=Cylas formicarius TaxID=197179 RepID=UPI0029584E93|nr:dr1-associated corepressor [Cylas formicarius]
MPSKKKKYNARFPAGRIKKIMQTDEEVGKVAQAVPVIISKALEMFIESLLKKSMQITVTRNAKTLTPSHMKQCILSENRFDFLKDLVKNVPDASIQEDNENNALVESMSGFDKADDSNSVEICSSPDVRDNSPPPPASLRANFYSEQSTSTATTRSPVIQFGPKAKESAKLNFSVSSILNEPKETPKVHLTIASQELSQPRSVPVSSAVNFLQNLNPSGNIPPLVPISGAYCAQSAGDNLCIDEDYDN